MLLIMGHIWLISGLYLFAWALKCHCHLGAVRKRRFYMLSGLLLGDCY